MVSGGNATARRVENKLRFGLGVVLFFDSFDLRRDLASSWGSGTHAPHTRILHVQWFQCCNCFLLVIRERAVVLLLHRGIPGNTRARWKYPQLAGPRVSPDRLERGVRLRIGQGDRLRALLRVRGGHQQE